MRSRRDRRRVDLDASPHWHPRSTSPSPPALRPAPFSAIVCGAAGSAMAGVSRGIVGCRLLWLLAGGNQRGGDTAATNDQAKMGHEPSPLFAHNAARRQGSAGRDEPNFDAPVLDLAHSILGLQRSAVARRKAWSVIARSGTPCSTRYSRTVSARFGGSEVRPARPRTVAVSCDHQPRVAVFSRSLPLCRAPPVVAANIRLAPIEEDHDRTSRCTGLVACAAVQRK